MTKPEVIRKLADDQKFTLKEAGEVLDSILNTIAITLQTGEEVALHGFGKFVTVTAKARVGRNPQTGEKVAIPARRVVKFKPAKELKEDVA